MLNFFLFLSFAFLFILFLGRFLEKIRTPGIFAGLILGALLAFRNPFVEVTSSPGFELLAKFGMYFLLFMVGMEIDWKQFLGLKGLIVRGTALTIFLDSLFGSLLVHFVFGYSWMIAVLVSMSFATVGEAILIPILDEFKMVNTKLGQAIVGIGTADDIVEVAALVFAGFLVGSHAHADPLLLIMSLSGVFLLTMLFRKFRTHSKQLAFMKIEPLFLLMIAVLFLFIGVGLYSEADALAALLAGISVNAFIPKARMSFLASEVKSLAYGFFAPIFFIWVGLALDMNYLVRYPLAILLVTAVSNGAKILGSYFAAHKDLGFKPSILLGIGLSVRFSTSIVIVKILYDSHLIGADLYSIIIASSIVFKLVVPLLFSNLLVRWKLAFASKRAH